MSLKSFYLLSFSVAPGGAHKDTHFVRGTLDEIKADLAAELSDATHLYLLCCYGARLTLDAYQSGALAASIALQPLITISIEGYPTITFEHDCEPVGYDFKTESEEAADEGSLAARLFDDEFGKSLSVTVAWERVDVPALVEPVARPGDLVSLEGVPHDGASQISDAPATAGLLPYGRSDLED